MITTGQPDDRHPSPRRSVGAVIRSEEPTPRPDVPGASAIDARDGTPLPGWLDQLTTSGLPPLVGIATALREDQHAVCQGITTHYNSGVNEGRITDVKLQKRIMAGRAGVPLLRHRVVLIAHLRRRYTA
ncbi:hypothetical protein ACIRL2_49495 [Embleya sp. NPDC127516]|uniref:hypothetical protein n=1 Tax=Embleya sp. NPDC127516 TaxID=3363990 RepID=UPI003801B927